VRYDVATRVRPLSAVRLRLLSFSTGDVLAQEITRALAAAGLQAEIAHPGFGLVIPELLAPTGETPDAVVVLLDAAGFFSRDWRQPTEVAQGLFAERTDAFASALETFLASSSAPVIINSLPSAVAPQVGFHDLHHPDGASFLVHSVNRRLQEIAVRHPRLVLIDADLALAHIAPVHRSDPKLWFYGRLPYSGPATSALAKVMAHALAAPRKTPVKVLALDLDDTLWRGIYGEQGLDVECGDDFPGNAFKAFQHECLRLKAQGLLLTILSKNDADVLRVFDEHPGLALKREDFVAHRINWSPKPDNIRALAHELDLGLDSFLFLDDSPHEREAMRRLAPEVHVPELPADPALRPQFLRTLPSLWPAQVTKEDRERTKLYAVQLKGRALQKQAASLEDYLAGLEQRLTVAPVTAAGVPRIAQMHARTNQFNLTTLRLSEAEIATMIADESAYCVLQGRLADRFGEHGVVICAIAELDGRRASILSLLMSCRVIGREVETAFLGAVLQHLRARGIDEVEGRFVPTSKNGPAREFYRKAGFAEGASADDEGQTWLWHMDSCALPGSDFVAVTMEE
jgi:FkbH-like protein